MSDPVSPRIASYTDARGVTSAGCGCALHTLDRGTVVAQACPGHIGRMVVEFHGREALR